MKYILIGLMMIGATANGQSVHKDSTLQFMSSVFIGPPTNLIYQEFNGQDTLIRIFGDTMKAVSNILNQMQRLRGETFLLQEVINKSERFESELLDAFAKFGNHPGSVKDLFKRTYAAQRLLIQAKRKLNNFYLWQE